MSIGLQHRQTLKRPAAKVPSPLKGLGRPEQIVYASFAVMSNNSQQFRAKFVRPPFSVVLPPISVRHSFTAPQQKRTGCPILLLTSD